MRRRRKNAESVEIMAKRIGQSAECEQEGGFLSVSGRCVIGLLTGFDADAAAAGVVAAFEDAACNSSSWDGSCYCCIRHHLHHHAGTVHVGSSPALGP